MMEPVSEGIYAVLMRQGVASRSVGAQSVRGIKEAGSSQVGARRQVVADAAGGEELHRPLPRSVSPGKLKLVWTNPAMTKTAGRRTNRAVLVMIGK